MEPLTSVHAKPVIDAPVVGLTPMFPLMTEVGTLVMPVPARIANGAAVPRFTVGMCAARAVGLARPIALISRTRAVMTVPVTSLEFFIRGAPLHARMRVASISVGWSTEQAYKS